MSDGGVEIDDRTAQVLAQRFPGMVLQAIATAAFDSVAYIDTHFTESVSTPGDPPGVVTGALKASIHAFQSGAQEYTISDGVPYGVDQEFGTRYMAARPFMMPTIWWVQGQMADYFRAMRP